LKVLLRAPNWIGDAVLALPAVAALAERRDIRLSLLAPPSVHPLFESLAGAILLPVDPGVRNVAQAWSVARAVAADDDVGLVFPRSFSSALVLRLAGIPRRIGRQGDGRGFLLTERLPAPPSPPRPLPPAPASGAEPGRAPEGFHRWRDYAELAERVLGAPVPERYPLRVPSEAGGAAARLIAAAAGRGPLVGLNPGATAPSRRWPQERFAAVGRRLRQAADARVVVLGGRLEAPLARDVAAAVPGAASLAGRTDLKTLMGVLAALDLLVTNDTGPMHLAAALGTPLLDLCGAADERVTGPRGPRARVLRERLFCSPCVRNVCPFDLQCMRALTTDRVAAAALAELGEDRAA